jgi:hypothetical protein
MEPSNSILKTYTENSTFSVEILKYFTTLPALSSRVFRRRRSGILRKWGGGNYVKRLGSRFRVPGSGFRVPGSGFGASVFAKATPDRSPFGLPTSLFELRRDKSTPQDDVTRGPPQWESTFGDNGLDILL